MRPTTLSRDPDLVAFAIRGITEHIKTQRLALGDKLPSEAEVAREFGVSRTVVREAIRSLAALRLVSVTPSRGACVGEIGDGPLGQILEHAVQTEQCGVQHVYDARRAIEVRTAALAALRRTDDEAESILAHAKSMEKHFHDPHLGMEHDIAFHLAIARASRNPLFALLVGSFSSVTRKTWPIGWRSRASDYERMEMVRIHCELAEAIAAGDADRAAELIQIHFDDSVKALVNGGIR